MHINCPITPHIFLLTAFLNIFIFRSFSSCFSYSPYLFSVPLSAILHHCLHFSSHFPISALLFLSRLFIFVFCDDYNQTDQRSAGSWLLGSEILPTNSEIRVQQISLGIRHNMLGKLVRILSPPSALLPCVSRQICPFYLLPRVTCYSCDD